MGSERSISLKSYDGWESFTNDNFIVGIASASGSGNVFGTHQVDDWYVGGWHSVTGSVSSVSHSYDQATGILTISGGTGTSGFTHNDYPHTGGSINLTVTTFAYLVYSR